MSVVRVLELEGRDVAAVLEQANVVEPIDPCRGGVFNLIDPMPRPFVADHFSLVEAIVGLGERTVVGGADTPH